MKVRTSLGLTAAIWLTAFAAHAAITGPIKTGDGMVKGTVEGDLAVYKGIPFAAPPVGDRRFKPPASVEPWSGVRQTTQFAPSCMQNSMPIPALGIPALTVSEDCLYLNVWTPAASAAARLPVMVWIYGGGFTSGSTSIPLYSGEKLAEKGVVVVSVAYRVGPFGFLAHPGLSAESPHHVSGNYGLLDQIAGLKWVKSNIAAFGGDPERVTIFGESAGGISVSMLAASPLAKGLFEGAISESGGSFGATTASTAPGENVQPLASAEAAGEAFAAKLGAKTVGDLRALSPEAIQSASAGQMGIGWPVLDGRVIAGDQYTLYEHGEYNDVPVLIGTNSDEGALFVRRTTAKGFVESVHERYGPYADRLLDVYPALSDEGALQSARDLMRDVTFGWHTWAWARLQAGTGKSKVFVYYFDHKPPERPNSPFHSEGASHGSELAYVFQHLNPPTPYTEQDRKISDAMATYWTNFAKRGDPNGGAVPTWPAFTADQPSVMYLDEALRPGPVPNLRRLRAVGAYMKWRRSEERASAH